MTHAAARRSLRILARAHWVQTGYRGTDGRRHAASDEALIGILRALGVQLERAQDAPELTRAAAAKRSRRAVEPVLVKHGDAPLECTATLPESLDPAAVHVLVRSDQNDERHMRLSDLEAARVGGGSTDGHRWVRWHVRVPDWHPEPGYHSLELEAPRTETATATVVCAPARCPQAPRSWGVHVPLHALRSARDWGVGSFGDMGRLSGWVSGLGGGFVGTLPLSAAFDDVPFGDPSPYMPASRLAWNEVYVDIESVPELARSPEALAAVSSPAMRGRLDGLRRRGFCDPAAVSAAKREVLGHLARSLCSGDSARRGEFEAYVRERPQLVGYARFRSECERRGTPFTQWPRAVSDALRARVPSGALSHDPRALTHLYSQWVAAQQLSEVRGRGAGLHLDLPVGVHPAGFDPWWEPDAFATSASGGAPPDDFFAGGQLWGFPPLHPRNIRQQGYRHVAAVFRHLLAAASSVRIDHVMGLHRLYWVPDGLGATDGAYVRYRADELQAVLRLEAHVAGTAVVGEDLGTVPGAVVRAMRRDGLLRSFVFEFRSRTDDPLPDPPEASFASLATHDLSPFAGYWQGSDIDDRCARGELDPAAARSLHADRAGWRGAVSGELDRRGLLGDGSEQAVLSACLAFLANGPARLVSVDLEDLWLETAPQNRPGTGPEEGNFLRRAARSIEDACDDPDIVGILRRVSRARRSVPEMEAGPEPHTDARTERLRPAESGGCI